MRCGIDVYADAVYAVLDNARKSFVKASGLHIVLVLTHAYRLRLYLNKLRKGVLQAACDGYRTSLHYVKIGEFVCSELGCRVDRRTCLADYDIPLLQELIDLQQRTIRLLSQGQIIVLNEREVARTVRSDA